MTEKLFFRYPRDIFLFTSESPRLLLITRILIQSTLAENGVGSFKIIKPVQRWQVMYDHLNFFPPIFACVSFKTIIMKLAGK